MTHDTLLTWPVNVGVKMNNQYILQVKFKNMYKEIIIKHKDFW